MKRYQGLPIGELLINQDPSYRFFVLTANHYLNPRILHSFRLSKEWIEDSLQTDAWTDRYVHARMFVNLHIKFLARGS